MGLLNGAIDRPEESIALEDGLPLELFVDAYAALPCRSHHHHRQILLVARGARLVVVPADGGLLQQGDRLGDRSGDLGFRWLREGRRRRKQQEGYGTNR